jgi:hypothetical protein
MQDGKCRNCGKGSVHYRSCGNSMFDLTTAHKTPLGNASYAVFKDYVCVTCGYSESFVEDEKTREAIKTSWPQAGKD